MRSIVGDFNMDSSMINPFNTKDLDTDLSRS